MATRKVIRPKFASVQDGYSRESIEDMLVAWSAFWADVPVFRARVESLRADAAAEPLLASVWTLRMSKDQLALDRAKKSLDETVPLGPEIVGLATRDPEFARALFRFQPTPVSFEAWLSTFVAGRAPRPALARGLATLWQREESTWSADTASGPATVVRHRPVDQTVEPRAVHQAAAVVWHRPADHVAYVLSTYSPDLVDAVPLVAALLELAAGVDLGRA